MCPSGSLKGHIVLIGKGSQLENGFMRSIIFFIAALLCATVAGAQTKTAADMEKDEGAAKFIGQIVGIWKLQRIVDEAQANKSTTNRPTERSKDEKGRPTTKTDQGQNAMQMIEFNPNARYKVNNSTTAVDSGSFRVNEQHGLLYLESDADDVTPSEWAITLEDNRLTLVGRGQDAEHRYKYIYRRQRK